MVQKAPYLFCSENFAASADSSLPGKVGKRQDPRKIIGAIAVILGWSFSAITIFQTFFPGIVFATPGMPINATLIVLTLAWAFSAISAFFLKTRQPLYLPVASTVTLLVFLVYFTTIGGG